MPLIEVTLAEGRTAGQIRSMLREVHQAVLRTVGTRPEFVLVVVREVPRSHWATGDTTLLETGMAHRENTGVAAGTPPRTEEQS